MYISFMLSNFFFYDSIFFLVHYSCLNKGILQQLPEESKFCGKHCVTSISNSPELVMGCGKYMQKYLGEGVLGKHPSFAPSKYFCVDGN